MLLEQTAPPTPPAPYDAVADVYDLLTAGQAHASWLASIERLARDHGLRGRRVLDVACGTGKSFLPLLDLGYDVVACDLSGAMAALARDAARGRAAVHVADMRRLPAFGPVDLVLCLNDAVNHLTESSDVAAFLRGARRTLRPGGLLVFDVTTPLLYGSARDAVMEDERRVVVFRGSQARIDADGLTSVCADIFTAAGGDGWRRHRFEQRQRCWPAAALLEALTAAGLEPLHVYGQAAGGVLDERLDEQRHPKALLVARRPLSISERKEARDVGTVI